MTAEQEAEAAKQAAEAEKVKAAEKVAEDARKAKEAEAAKAEEGKTIPLADFKKLQADLDNFKRIEEERKGKERLRQEALLKEQGKWKDLYDTAVKENETMKARLDKLDGVMKGMLDEEMKGLPEDFDKTLIPALDPHDQLVWLKKAKAIIVPQKIERKGDGTPAARANEGLSGMRSIYTHPTSPKH